MPFSLILEEEALIPAWQSSGWIIPVEAKSSQCVICICWENNCSCHFPKSLGTPFHILTVPYSVLLSHSPKEMSKGCISSLLWLFDPSNEKHPHKLCEGRGLGLAYILCADHCTPRDSERKTPMPSFLRGCGSCSWSVLGCDSKSLSWKFSLGSVT